MSDTSPPETGDQDQPETGTSTEPETGTQAETDWKAEADKWAEMSRKNEARAKANASAARELEQLKRQSMNDTERAVAEAVARARDEMASSYGGRLVEAHVRAAAAGRPVDAEALLDGLDRRRFLNDDGEPDTKAITAWLDKVAPVRATEPVPLDLGQGQRVNGPTGADMNVLLRQAAGRT